jgi:hypothetical protein
VDVYIKYASKPKTCETCNFADCHSIFPFCDVDRNPLFPEHFKDGGNENCPLIPIKEGHGNLIDADVLIAQLKEMGCFKTMTFDDAISIVKEQPILVDKEEPWEDG